MTHALDVDLGAVRANEHPSLRTCSRLLCVRSWAGSVPNRYSRNRIPLSVRGASGWRRSRACPLRAGSGRRSRHRGPGRLRGGCRTPPATRAGAACTNLARAVAAEARLPAPHGHCRFSIENCETGSASECETVGSRRSRISRMSAALRFRCTAAHRHTDHRAHQVDAAFGTNVACVGQLIERRSVEDEDVRRLRHAPG